MEKPFLKLVAEHIRDRHKDKVADLCIVLPGKRGAVFLKRHLAEAFGSTFWLPKILSADELVAELVGLLIPDEPELVCELFGSYRDCLGEKAEPFESFVKWGQMILHDFNEIDRYLADSGQLYENLRNIREIENWSLGAEQLSPQQQRYVDFMGHIGVVYGHLRDKLLKRGMAWPGLAYRHAAEKGDFDRLAAKYHKILFCGFNALSRSEIAIIRRLVKAGAAETLWDADHYYLDREEHEAGHFMRQNLSLFPSKETLFVGDHFKTEKEIRIISVPRQVGQALVVRQTLSDLHHQGVGFDRVAIVLANEQLLLPVLQLLPPEVEQLNITMEYPLQLSAVHDLVDAVLAIHQNYSRQNRKNMTLYHKDLSHLLRQPLLAVYMKAVPSSASPIHYVNELSRRNLAFIDWRLAEDLFGNDAGMMAPLLKQQPAGQVLAHLREMIGKLAGLRLSPMEHEQVAVMLKVFNRVSEISERYPFFDGIGPLRHLFTQVVSGASVPFVGEPLAGLQLMGVLETRTLDFEHVIMVSVNEGVLPSGRTVNSFIPNDLKQVNGLPLYQEKDAVYAYHFYRLLQRARTATIICDSETDTFGKGEKSRFVTQLLLEMKRHCPAVRMHESVAVQNDLERQAAAPLQLPKNESTLANIARKALGSDTFGGLSPSSLISYKACGLRFYLRYGALLKETDEVEETAEAGTFGSILHLSLERLYQQVAGRALTPAELDQLLPLVDGVVEESFKTVMMRPEISGKNLLQMEAIRVYVRKLIAQDRRQAAEPGRVTRVTHLEHQLSAELRVAAQNSMVVFVKGQVDRIDVQDGITRIIDYKSSVKKNGDKFLFTGFEDLFQDPAYDKQLQLFIYTWLAWKNRIAPAHRLRPCIIPFREFADEPYAILAGKAEPFVFTDPLLEQFEAALSDFIGGIFSRESSFIQTGDTARCAFCAYATVCNVQS